VKPALRHKGSFMHTDCVPKEKPTGDSNPPAGHTDSVILPSAEKIGNHEKHFATLRAAFALRGHRLELAFHGESKEPTYYAERWGNGALACPPCTMRHCSWQRSESRL
jgi:hypothetical protein